MVLKIYYKKFNIYNLSFCKFSIFINLKKKCNFKSITNARHETTNRQDTNKIVWALQACNDRG